MVSKLEALNNIINTVSAVEDADGNYMDVIGIITSSKLLRVIYDNEELLLSFKELIDEDYILYKEVQVDLIYDNK